MNVDKNFLMFSFAFGLIFFSFAAAQQYLTVEFNKTSNLDIAFMSILLIYLFAAIFSPISAYVVSKFNPKKGIIIPGYCLFAFLRSSCYKKRNGNLYCFCITWNCIIGFMDFLRNLYTFNYLQELLRTGDGNI